MGRFLSIPGPVISDAFIHCCEMRRVIVLRGGLDWVMIGLEIQWSCSRPVCIVSANHLII